MLDNLFSSVFDRMTSVWGGFLIALAAAFAVGLFLAFCYSRRAACSGSFFMGLGVLPAVVCLVIFVVNGNLGAGVAVAGAFSLVRFRSAAGSAREICAVFVSMAVGLALGMGYVGYALLFAVLSEGVLLLYHRLGFGEQAKKTAERDLRITVPENLNYTGLFDDLFTQYTTAHRLTKVKSSNMGSLFRLSYRVSLTDAALEKEFLDTIRTRNGNLEISSCEPGSEDGEL